MTRILVVDDDPAMRRMIRLTLISEGFDVTMASDGHAHAQVTGPASPPADGFDPVPETRCVWARHPWYQ